MTHLTSSVVEIPQCKREDVQLCFLNGNVVYLTSRVQGRDKSKSRWKIDVTRLNQKLPVDSSEWPVLPKFQPTTWNGGYYIFGKYMCERSMYCKYKVKIDGFVTMRGGKPRPITDADRTHRFLEGLDYNHFSELIRDKDSFRFLGISQEWLDAARLEADAIMERRNDQLRSKFVPMREAGEELTSIVAGILNFDGEPKQLVQGLKKLGIEIRGEWKRNFVTKGLMVDNLEEQLFTESRSEDPT